jgi:hypothetical protein
LGNLLIQSFGEATSKFGFCNIGYLALWLLKSMFHFWENIARVISPWYHLIIMAKFCIIHICMILELFRELCNFFFISIAIQMVSLKDSNISVYQIQIQIQNFITHQNQKNFHIF